MKTGLHRWHYVAGLSMAALVAIMALWNWNWFRPLAEREASGALGRKVTIGNLDVALSLTPMIVLDGITIGNPAGFPGDSTMATIDRLAVTIDGRAALGGTIHLPEITIDHPQGDFRANPRGNRNWMFGGTGDSGGALPRIDRLVINNGNIRFIDPALEADFRLAIHTTDSQKSGEQRIVATASGTYAAQPISAEFRGGALLSIQSRTEPYPIRLSLKNGATTLLLAGTVSDPVHFAGANLKLDLSGKDLNDLYPLIGVPLAPTPPYKLTGRLNYIRTLIRFEDFTGTVGSSDLSGTFSVNPHEERPKVFAALTSKSVDLRDLGGFIGAKPGDEKAPGAPAAKTGAKVLPATPINLPEIKVANFDVRYHADHIKGESMPLDDMTVHFIIQDGRIILTPLSFGIGKGQILANVSLDAREKEMQTRGDIDFQKLDLHRILSSTGPFEGKGTIAGKADIRTTGNSVAEMAANGDGNLKLFMEGGNLSALLVNLAGLDLGSSVLSMLGIPSRAPVRCMITDFGMTKGQVKTRLMLIDTTEANINGTGSIDLAREQIDYRITTDPKNFSIGSIQAPILIRGALGNPSIYPDPVALGARGGTAAVLGVLLTPLGALIPTIQLGLGEDTDCAKTIAEVKAGSPSSPKTEEKKN
ncbi:MAG: AsmA family protein [Parvibaculaceae bacterium]|nr:AsmA family protein [Parvibaculaceae bacterium]